MVTTLPSHEVKTGTTTGQTFSGGDAMEARAESGTPVSNSSSVGDTTAGMVLNNGPGGVVAAVKGPVNSGGSAPSTSGTVIIQTSAATGATMTVVRPAVQTAPAATALAVNGSNVQQAPAAGTGVTLTLTPQTSGQPLAPALITKPELAKSIIQSAAGTVAVAQQIHVSPGPAKGAVLQQSIVRTAVPASSPAGVRVIAPQQVLAPRLPQSNPGQPSIQNIQLPPGTSPRPLGCSTTFSQTSGHRQCSLATSSHATPLFLSSLVPVTPPRIVSQCSELNTVHQDQRHSNLFCLFCSKVACQTHPLEYKSLLNHSCTDPGTEF